ncbi:MAG: hypothetical protein H8E26_14270 [FCB group bacterium]|nr:hypothetical protein [FCB group bacterium]MBL7027450.1 hypothetical protein [Candidatus Neomarinimicrobiota bacterium]MBL7122063.1 hypothetical protein [Candidatus Neomarinimicrobiota bacterium]
MIRLLVIVLFLGSVLAEDVYLKNGGYFKNIQIFKEVDKGIVLVYGEEHIQVLAKNLERIDRTPYNPNILSSTNTSNKFGEVKVSNRTSTEGQGTGFSFNKSMIPIALLSFYWSFQNFSALSDLDGLPGFENLQDDLRRDGFAFLAIGAVTVGLSLEFESIDVPPDSLSVKSN